jgi:hypothetical protein
VPQLTAYLGEHVALAVGRARLQLPGALIVGLELAVILGDMGLDPALVVRTEVDEIVTAATGS